MGGSRWLLFLIVPLLGLGLFDSSPVLGFPCPSVVHREFCAAAPLPWLNISVSGAREFQVPWSASTTVGELEELLTEATMEIGAGRLKERPEELEMLFWNLSFSLSLWRFGETTSEQELVLGLGRVASLEAKLHFLTSLIGLMMERLGGSALPEEQEMSLVLKLEDLNLTPGIILKGESTLTLEGDLNFFLDTITLTVTNGTLRSDTDVEPKSFLITEERLGVEFNLGPIVISSGVVIGDKRVTKEVIRMSATAGELSLVSEASFTTESQEFKVGATIGKLELSSTSVLTPTGLGSQTFQLELEF
jgi:hypothetical protein